MSQAVRKTETGLLFTEEAHPARANDLVRSFGTLKGAFFATIPHAGEDLTASEVEARLVECRSIIQQMRSDAFAKKNTQMLGDVHILTHELNLAAGALRKMYESGTRIYRPGES